MTDRIKQYLNFLKRLSVFDWLVIFVVLMGLAFFSQFIFKEEKWIKIEVILAPREVLKGTEGLPYWLTDVIRKGDKQYGNLGKIEAEVLDVFAYELPGGRKISSLVLGLKVSINRNKQKYIFNNRPVQIGERIDLAVGNIGVQGLITYVEGVSDTRTWEEKIIEAKVTRYEEVFPETLGIDPWLAEAVKVGDQVIDTQGRVVGEIMEKRAVPSQKIVTTADGRVLIRQDPIKKDVTLVVKLNTLKQNSVNYFLNIYPVKVGSIIFLPLKEIDITLEITKIIE